MTQRPIIGVTCLLIIGTGAGLQVGGSGVLPLVLGFAAATAAAISFFWAGRSASRDAAAVAVCVCCAGFLAGALSQRTRWGEHRWLGNHASEWVYVRGVVDRATDVPSLNPRATRPVIPLRQVAIEYAEGVRSLTQTRAGVTWYGGSRRPHEIPQVGETWAFRTRLPRLRMRAGNPCLPVNSRPNDAVRLAPPAFWDWRPIADQARHAAVRRLSLGIESWPAAPALIQAMLLGLRSAVPREMNAIFRNSGTIHVFAISGLGIGLVAAVIATALSLLAVPRPRWGLALIPLLTGYALLTGASPSAMRACLMAAFYFGAPLVHRKPDACAALAAAAILQIAWDPRALFNVSFLLSYTVMAGLVLLCPPLSRLFRRALGVESATTQVALLRLSQRLTSSRQRLTRQAWAVRLAVWRRTALGYLADTLAMGFAAWLASVPLTAYYFGRFIPGGLLANLVVVPAAFLIVIAGALAIVTSGFLPAAAVIFNHAAAACATVMLAASRLTTRIPGASITVPAPPVAVVVAWYAGMLLVAGLLRRRRSGEAPFISRPVSN